MTSKIEIILAIDKSILSKIIYNRVYISRIVNTISNKIYQKTLKLNSRIPYNNFKRLFVW